MQSMLHDGWPEPIVPATAALLLSGVFVVGRRLGILDRKYRGRRRLFSAAAGASVAYIFVNVMPELGQFQAAFSQAAARRNLPFPEYRVYTSALMGFVLFHGLDSLVMASRTETHQEPCGHVNETAIGAIQIGGFAMYCALISYLMVGWTRGSATLALYCTAMAFHFFVIDHSLRSEHGVRYDGWGRWILALATLAGWAVARRLMMPDAAMATLQGFVAGGVTINSVKDEIPAAGEGRFGYFAMGAFAFALLMMLSCKQE
mgnify:FL=1